MLIPRLISRRSLGAFILCLSAALGCDTPTESVPGASPTPTTQLVSGANVSCLLRPDDGLWCWGSNNPSGGELPTLIPPPQGDGPFVEVSAGSHLCALTASGNAYCWGENRRGGVTVSGSADENVPLLATPLFRGNYHWASLGTAGLHRNGAISGGRFSAAAHFG